MTGYQSKKQARHADDITLENLIKLRAENERLRKKYKEAIDDIYEWGSYSSMELQKKWDLAGTIAAHRAALKDGE